MPSNEFTVEEIAGALTEPLGHSFPVRASDGPVRGWLVANKRVVGIAARTLVVSSSSFVVLLADRRGLLAAAGLAVLSAVVWSALSLKALEAARIKRVALGLAASTTVGVAAGLVVLSAATFLVPQLGFRPLPLAAMAALAFVLIWTSERVLERLLVGPDRLLIVGAKPWGAELLEAIAGASRCNFEVVGVIDDESDVQQIAGVPLLGKIADLADAVRRERPDLVVIAVDRARPEVFAQLLDVAEENFSLIGLPEFYEQAFGRLPIRNLTPAWFMSVLHLYQRPYSRVVKRTFDLSIATFALVVLAPLFPLIALLVRLSSGPAIYRQTRLGEFGRLFTIYKFRTMRVDSEENGHVWAVERDPRVTKIGRLLRKTRLDEIPQLWNVIKGDMSIVGPRPERPEYLASLSKAVPYWTSRHLLKPGITGWAQVNDGYASDFESTERKLSYDLWYLRHRSLAIDLLVCAKTVARVSSGSSGW